MQVMSETATRGRERERQRERQRDRERDREKYAQNKSDRESLQFRFLLEFSDKNFYYHEVQR